MAKKLTLTIKDFEKWLRERGYDKRMGEQNFQLFLDFGLAGLLFVNSSLLMGYIFSNLGFPSERIAENVRFKLGQRIKEIKATKDYLEIVL